MVEEPQMQKNCAILREHVQMTVGGGGSEDEFQLWKKFQ